MITRIERSLAANEVVDNMVSGRSIEFAPDDAIMNVLAATTATGVRIQGRLTDEVVLDESACPFLTGGQPIFPDHLVIPRQAVARGDHLIFRAQNTTAGALVLVVLFDVSPV